MFRYLEHLRTEPAEKRRAVAFVATVVLLVLFVLLWLVLGSLRASLFSSPEQADTQPREVGGIVSPY